ncbi:MAG: ThaI family type II restriction endonuclease [candidate division Zixibacteria bacterium]|nr:ThaI family type II restriction endonuclease [Candidatus Tariuqbacter arcticus]
MIKNKILYLFEDEELIMKIKNRLPILFSMAEIEHKRGKRTGMEVGNTREKIIIALLMYKYGEDNIKTEIPTTESEIDVMLFNNPISIKTLTGDGGFKLSWTVDAQMARKFAKDFVPTCDILFIQIKWDLPETKIKNGLHPGGLFFIPLNIQKEVLLQLGVEKYFKLPKLGTNPRGVEISKEALNRLIFSSETKCIEIIWKKSVRSYSPYKRWLDLWMEE